MNEKNFKSLKDQVMYTGFGNAHEFQLKENMEKGLPEFQLSHGQEFGKDKVDATLYFKKSDQDNYFFNKYDLLLTKEGSEPLKQTFYLNKPQQAVHKVEGAEDKTEWVNSNIPLREAYNMMDGRAVLKDYVSKANIKYDAWAMLDFKNTDQNGNYNIIKKAAFDLEAKLAAYPIKELANAEHKKQLIESLQKGNRQSVTILYNGVEEKRAIEANPQFKTVNLYDVNGRVGQIQSEDKDHSEKQSQNEKLKNDTGEDAPRKTQRLASRKRNGISS